MTEREFIDHLESMVCEHISIAIAAGVSSHKEDIADQKKIASQLYEHSSSEADSYTIEAISEELFSIINKNKKKDH